ncbi:DNA polymerase III subunit delta' [Thermodesulfobacteriota bacterium]
MSGFESIIDQQKPLRILSTLFRNGNIPHALLFTGIEGVGKKTSAKVFAMACNCAAQTRNAAPAIRNEKKVQVPPDPHKPDELQDLIHPCGCCRSCRKIESNNHPDIIFIKPSGAFIRINQIRTLFHSLSMKPYEAELRVVVISDAQTLHPAAANALLKMLEEPPDRTILILTAQHTSDLLPTIASRCQHIRFNPISRINLTAMLVEKQGLDPDDAAIFAIMANGSFAKALSMTRPKTRESWINRRNWLLNELVSLSSRPVGLHLAFAEQLSKNREVLSDSLEVIKSFLRDLVVFKYYPEKIINKDLTDMIQYASEKMPVGSLLSKIEDVQTAQKNIQANANLRLTLEILAMRLAIGYT